MKLKKPKFWDNKKPNLLAILLIPFTIPIRINNFFNQFITSKKIKESNNQKIRTICIGNIYLGGTGKTPLAIKIEKILKNLNFKTVFIKKNHKESYDEQKLLEKHAPVLSGPIRAKTLNSASENYDVAIFDDGLQDSSINYDLKLVCFNTKNFIGNGLLIPAGPLREKITSLKKYDAVFLNGNNENSEKVILEIKKQNKDIKIFETSYTLTELDTIDKNSNYVAFAGIGNPINFYNSVTNSGIKIVKFLEYPDHHMYDDNDIKTISDIAKNLDAKIITTEKDYSRLEISDEFLLRKNIQFIKLKLETKNESELINLIKTII